MDIFSVILDYFNKGGIVMYFILLASILGVAIAIERYIFLKKLENSKKKLFSISLEKINKGQVRDLMAIYDSENNTVSRIFKTAIETYLKGASKEDIENSIGDIAKIELPIINRYLYLLGTMVSISPMLGLLGTVTGMIKATTVLAEKGLSSPSELLAGIAEALITTAAGLIVAIPLLIIYNYLANKAEGIIQEIEANTTQIILSLSSSKDMSIW
jgi:biopolymer transport protein ExbB